ncbi:MAG: NUDIX domain-containing protein [Clostridium sp.]
MKFDFNLEKEKLIENIVKIEDKDFGILEKINKESSTIRIGARGIVLDKNGNIAVIYKEKKNEYKLPGGGVEDEDINKAFIRECREELGMEVDIKKLIGTAEEYKSQENFKQISYVFIAEKIFDLPNNNLTIKEKEEGTKYIWMNKFEAIEKMKNSLNNLKASKYDNIYRTKFIVLRDIKILEYYINNFK